MQTIRGNRVLDAAAAHRADRGRRASTRSLCHGFIFDFCGVEVDRTTGAVRIDKYVTMHDCGRVLHPGMVAGQVTGGFAHALGAALYEEYAYTPTTAAFISGTFADYLLPTTTEVPAPLDPAFRESPSPFTPLGAKGRRRGQLHVARRCASPMRSRMRSGVDGDRSAG